MKDRRKTRLAAALLAGLYIGAFGTHAEDATWKGVGGGPAFGLWNEKQNWQPGKAVPTGTAFFATNSPADITISTTTDHPGPVTNIDRIEFEAGALAYSFTNDTTFDITGAGIVNNSTSSQTFINNSLLNFHNSARPATTASLL